MINSLKFLYGIPRVIYVVFNQLTCIKPVLKKLVNATGAENYNILQNNGRIAHQEVDHVSLGTRILKLANIRIGSFPHGMLVL